MSAALNLRLYGLAVPSGPTGSSPESDACGDSSGGGTAPGPVYELRVEEAGSGRSSVSPVKQMTTRYGTAQDQHTGYTLLELVLTLSILAALVALGLPSFRGLLAERRVSYSAAEVQRLLRTAQQVATAQAGRFRRVEARFSHGDGPRAELWGVPWEGTTPAVPLGSATLGPGSTTVRKSGSVNFAIGFAASGSPLPGAHGTLEVRDGAAVRYVVISAVTGRVRISSTPPN